MTALENHQFEILPDDAATDGFVFGLGAAVAVDAEGFDPGENEWLTQDSQNSRRGSLGFGRDVLGAKTWAWESHVDQEDVPSALAVLEDFSSSWMPVDRVMASGELVALRYRLADRDRRVYGRPRRFAAPPTNLILNGYVDVTHDFQVVDSFTYDDLESSVEVAYNSVVSGGGFTLAAQMPIATTPSDGNGSGQASIGGNARAYPVVRFHGSWTNPSIDTGDWKITWKGTVRAGGYVEIDTRPWVLTVLDQDGASQAGGLDRQVWLEDCWFAPGSTPQFALDGVAPLGDAGVTVKWRNTWTSL